MNVMAVDRSEEGANSAPSSWPGDRLIQALRGMDFKAATWERKRLLLSGFFDAQSLGEVFPLDRFDEVLMGGALMSPHLDIVRGGRKVAAPFRQSPSPATDVSQVLLALKEGATIRVAHIEHYLPSLNAMCHTLEREFHLPFRANLYMTPPFSQGFAPHYDMDDIFVLQAFGRKQWYLHTRYSGQVPIPSSDMAFDAARHKPIGDPDVLTLDAGDVLYLPRGFMHEARTDEAASIHITFAAIGLKLSQVIEQLVKRLSIMEPRLRRTIGFDPDAPPDEAQLAALGEEIRESLSALTDPQMLASASNYLCNALAIHRNPDCRGRLVKGLTEGFDHA